jgi:O-antigen ligase
MNRQFRLAGWQPQGVSLAVPEARGLSRCPVNAAPKGRTTSLLSILTLRNLPADTLLLVIYVCLCGAFIGDEATLGIKVGPIPIFVTDATLIAVIAIAIRKRAGRLLKWGFSGSGAGAIGRAVWLLCLIALLYFALAFPKYRLSAVRDLAIFSYSLFFPLTYFTLTRRVLAVKLVRYFIYATCIGAALFNFQIVSGIQLFELVEVAKGIPGHQELPHLGSAGNLGADLSCALAGLFAYLAAERHHRGLHAGAMLLCLLALAQLMDRSAILGFFIACGLMFILGVGHSRGYLIALAAGLLALLLLSAQVELPIPGGARLHSLSLALSSAVNFQSDPDTQFRMERWQSAAQTWMTSPVLGVGFGTPIIKDEWVRDETKGAAQRSEMGSFNQGMPHNSFLMVLARTGPIGLGLISFAWITGIIRILKVLRRRAADPDELAIVGVLIAMVPYAALNLFFERPMLCVPFWIMLAASYKLSERAPHQFTREHTRAIPRWASRLSPQSAGYLYRGVWQDHVAGGWQARWK